MESEYKDIDSFDENQSIKVIREMIQVSQKKMKNDGVLFIFWGWLMFYNYISSFVFKKIVVTYGINTALPEISNSLFVVFD